MLGTFHYEGGRRGNLKGFVKIKNTQELGRKFANTGRNGRSCHLRRNSSMCEKDSNKKGGGKGGGTRRFTKARGADSTESATVMQGGGIRKRSSSAKTMRDQVFEIHLWEICGPR